MSRRAFILLLLLMLVWPPAAPAAAPPPGALPIHGIVFDPTDYYELRLSPQTLASTLADRWQRYGINLVYVNAYNVTYGAHYRTTHPFSVTDPLGRADFLRTLVEEAHRRGIRVFAAFYFHTHRGAWQAKREWRARRADGTDYHPRGVDAKYFLSIWHPEARAWWLDLLRELLRNYPEIDGIELREPVINWWGREADYNPYAVRAFRTAHPQDPLGGPTWVRWRADGLTTFLRQAIALVHAHGRSVHLTTVLSSWGDGRLLTARQLAAQTGFDLDGPLSGPPGTRPDAVKVELIWQQWANIYDYVTFSPAWTGRVTPAALAMIGGRTRAVIHVELTDFSQREVTPEETYLAMEAARRAGARDFDVYGARLADRKEAWPWLARGFGVLPAPQTARARPGPVRRILVLEDEDVDRSTVPRLATRLLINLLGHFDVLWEVRRVGEYRRGELDRFDAAIYQGTQWDAPLPAELLADLHRYDGPIVWIGANLWQLATGADSQRYGVIPRVPVPQYRAEGITLNGVEVRRALSGLGVTPAANGRVIAHALVGGVAVPLAVTNGHFWYVGGSLYIQPEQNPLHLVLADLLHDALSRPHPVGRPALLMVSGVHPQVDPAHLAALQRVMRIATVGAAVAVTPVFADPARRTMVTLSERPDVAAGLRALSRAGAEIVLTGYTHQFRGRTGDDVEFWDAVGGTARPDDGTALVRHRIEDGVRLLLDNGLVPLAWSTPGGLASPFDYERFGEGFSVLLERRAYGFSAGRPVQPRFPYRIERDLHGHSVFTPNVEIGRDHRPDAAVAAARELTAVRDPLAVVTVPVTTPPEALLALIGRMRQMGYAFTRLGALRSLRVTTDRVAIVSGRATLRLEIEGGEYLRTRDLMANGAIRRESVALYREARRVDLTVATDPGAVRIFEIRPVRPWSPEWLRLQAQTLRQGVQQRWAEDVTRERLPTLLGALLLVLSTLTLVLLSVLYLTLRIRRWRTRWP